MPERDWSDLERRHRAFWTGAQVERPLIGVLYDFYVDTELTAARMGAGELTAEKVDPRAVLGEFDKVARARQEIGDDVLALAEPPLGIPWLEAIAGCRVLAPDGTSLWPERPVDARAAEEIVFSAENPWFRKLMECVQVAVDYAGGRYGVSISHLRGPTDILVALLGAEQFSLMFYEDMPRLQRLARQAAALWLAVAQAQARIVPAWRGGHLGRQFGLWSPGRSVWLQDDTAGLISLRHYRDVFLGPMRTISAFEYGVLHLHIPALHVAETIADVPNVRAINVYFDSPLITLRDALPVLQRLQARHMPLILAKTVYEGFTLEEYAEILDGLSPRGLSVHLKAESAAEGREVMAQVKALAARE